MDYPWLASMPGPLAIFSTQVVQQLSFFLPRIVGALLVLLIGTAVAKLLRGLVVKLLEALKVSKLVSKTPVEAFLQNTEVGSKLEEVLGGVFYWLMMLLVLHTTVSILGLEPVSSLLDKIFNYIPHIFSAVLVLFFGVLIAGMAESLVKGAIKSIDGKAARLLGKVSSYLVMTIAVLAAVSELGIASEFIMIIFVGLIATISLGMGLALGLGGKEVVNKMLTEWYEKTRKELND